MLSPFLCFQNSFLKTQFSRNHKLWFIHFSSLVVCSVSQSPQITTDKLPFFHFPFLKHLNTLFLNFSFLKPPDRNWMNTRQSEKLSQAIGRLPYEFSWIQMNKIVFIVHQKLWSKRAHISCSKHSALPLGITKSIMISNGQSAGQQKA